MTKRTSTMVVVVGIFVVVGVILLFGFSLMASGPNVRGGYTLTTQVQDSKGLEIGAEVTRAGVPVGVVSDISLAPDSPDQVQIEMRLHKDAPVRSDALATIQLKSLLGSYYVHLTHGSADAPLAEDGLHLASEDIADFNEVMRAVAKIGDDAGGFMQGAEELVANVNKNQEDFFSKVNTVIDENRENLKTVTDSLAQSAPRMEGFFDSVGGVADALNNGEGALGKLLTDDTVYRNVEDASASLKDIAGRVQSGEGTLGKMIYDEKLADQLDETFQNIDVASRALKEALDSNSKDLNDLIKAVKDVTPAIDEAFQNFLAVSRKVNSQEGTLGKLVNDPELYDEARRAVTQIRKTFEEGEEQSVMRTFLGVFFGSMI